MKNLARWLFSINPVMIGMLSITAYLVLETTILLYQVLPEFVALDFLRWALAIFLSVAFHLTVLNISVNSGIINRWFAVVVALLTCALTMFFFQVLEREGIQQLLSATFALIVGFCNYSYVFMFVEKHRRTLKAADQAAEIIRLRDEISHTMERNSDLQSEVERLKSGNQQLKSRPVQSVSPPDSDAKKSTKTVSCEVCKEVFQTQKKMSNRASYCRSKKPEGCRGRFNHLAETAPSENGKIPAHETA